MEFNRKCGGEKCEHIRISLLSKFLARADEMMRFDSSAAAIVTVINNLTLGIVRS